MLLETGYVYHIKDEYFKFAKDEKLMKNHEKQKIDKNGVCDAIVNGINLIFPAIDRIEKLLLEDLNSNK